MFFELRGVALTLAGAQQAEVCSLCYLRLYRKQRQVANIMLKHGNRKGRHYYTRYSTRFRI